MGDVNLEIKLNNLDERVITIEESGAGGGDGYITSVSNDFNVVNKKLSLSNDVTTKLSKINSDGTLDFSNVNNAPTIPTVSDTYSETSSDAMSGKAVAQAVSGTSSKNWSLLNTVTGATPITINVNFNELLVFAKEGHYGANYTFYIPRVKLSNTDQYFNLGYCSNPTSAHGTADYGLMQIKCSLTTIALNQAKDAGGDYTNSTTIDVFYK